MQCSIPFRKHRHLTFRIYSSVASCNNKGTFSAPLYWSCFNLRLFSGVSLCHQPAVISFEQLMTATYSSKNSAPLEYLEREAPFENYFVQLLGCWSEYSSIDPGALFQPAAVGGRRGKLARPHAVCVCSFPAHCWVWRYPIRLLLSPPTPSPRVCLLRLYFAFSSLVSPLPPYPRQLMP